jgi:hypothetical protein
MRFPPHFGVDAGAALDSAKPKLADRAAPATIRKKNRTSAAPSWSSRSLYDGRDLIGTVKVVAKQFEARSAERKKLGRFRNFEEAIAAVVSGEGRTSGDK